MYQTREALEYDIQEKENDLLVFQEAQMKVYDRLVQSQDSDSPLPLHNWSGATGIYDLLQVVVNHLEKVRDELLELRSQFKDQPKPRPRLFLVREPTDE